VDTNDSTPTTSNSQNEYCLIPLTRGMFAKVDAADVALVSQYKWVAMPHGYTHYAISTSRKHKTILMHRLILGTPDGMDSHHLDRDGLNNQRSNLRVCTHAENMADRRPCKNSGVYTPRPIRSGKRYKGITYKARVGLWEARFKDANHNIGLGLYPTPEDGARAYDAKAKELHGSNVILNFPEQAEPQSKFIVKFMPEHFGRMKSRMFFAVSLDAARKRAHELLSATYGPEYVILHLGPTPAAS
jgi:hypothetical protein